MSKENNDDDNDDDDDNDIMQIDEERLNKKVIEGLRLLHLKSLYNFTEAAYNDIIKLFANKNISLYKVKKILKIQYNNKVRDKELLYCYEYITNKELDDNDLDDIFDGDIYKELLERNLFKNNRDIAFTISCDGYQIFKQKTDDCWAFLIINNNLDLLIRVKKENLLILFLIPEPKQLKDFNTFLRPFINEMKELEGKYFI